MKERSHLHRRVLSTIEIQAPPELVWEHITNVRIEQFSDPWIFRLLGVPKPLSADLLKAGEGGSRIAYFDSGKRFIQEITVWRPFEEYSFDFNPEKGFRVGYFFDLSDGVFQVPNGSYSLEAQDDNQASNDCVFNLSKFVQQVSFFSLKQTYCII